MIAIKGPIQLFPELYDISPFKLKEVPSYHPEHSRDYEPFWREQVKYCVEGKFGYDYDPVRKIGGWRYCPGPLYMHVNFTTMADSDDSEENSGEIAVRPKLRDVDWMIFYAFTACEGFSGFEFDNERSCFRALEKIHNGDELFETEKYWVEKYKKYLINPLTGAYKEYVPVLDYLYGHHKEPLGKPQFYNECKNLILLSSRGIGKSYSLSTIIANEFIFHGVKDYNKLFAKDIKGSTVVIGSANTDFSKETLDKFSVTYEYLRKEVGSFQDEKFYPGALWHPTNGTLATGAQTKYTNRVKNSSGQGYIGVGSRIVHVAFGSKKTEAGVGYRSTKMLVEEAGLLEHFQQIHNSNQASLRRQRKMGFTAYVGTGGNNEKIKGIKKAYYDPVGYDALPFEDKFNIGSNRLVGLFIPAYYRNSIHKDENGNTLLDRAYKAELEDRQAFRDSNDNDKLQGHIQAYPLTQDEMFMETGSNPFDASRITKRINELLDNPIKKSIGTIYFTDSLNTKVAWKEETNLKRKAFIAVGDEDREKDIGGYWLIYEHPKDGKNYYVVYDPVLKGGEGGSAGSSLASVVVYKDYDLTDSSLISRNIVAEWNGRFGMMEENHNQAIMATLYYGCKTFLPETNVNDILRHCRMNRKMHMLQRRPSIALDGILKSAQTYDYGVVIQPGMKSKLEAYLNELFNEKVNSIERIDGDVYTQEHETFIDHCPSLRLLGEALAYRREGNFDMISAMFVLTVWLRQEMAAPERDRMQEQLNKELEYFRKRDYMSKPFSSIFS